jgi:hypothetical protein
MRYHHTKNKGDLGVVMAMADLTAKGWIVLTPLTEHAPFDLVAYQESRFLRVQVKYRTAKNGVLTFSMSTCWADRHGVHSVPIDKSAIDVMVIYCPDTRECYYVDPMAFRKRVCLRIAPTKNAQSKGVVWAKDYVEIPAPVRGVLAGLSPPLERLPLVRHSREPRAVYRLSSAHSSAG